MPLFLPSLVVFLLVGLAVPAHAQSPASERKQGHATRVPSGSIRCS